MAVPTLGDFVRWVGNKLTNTSWNDNIQTLVNIFGDGTYDMNVNQITASTYVGLPTEDEVYNINVENGYLYISGAGNFETSQSLTPGQSVLVDTTGGSTIKGNDGKTYVSEQASATTIALPASDSSNPRWDLVEFDASAGTFSVNQGTAAANPTYPALGANKDPIAYVYRKASAAGNTVYNRDILDARVSIKNKTVDGHFKTNFSINQKEDTENSNFDNQQMFQMVPYQTEFDYVQEDKTNLQYIDTIVVPADSVNGEVVYTGSWSDSDSSNYMFGRAKYSNSAGDTAVFSFSGVSVNLIYMQYSVSSAFWTSELSSDGGVTYHSKKTFNNSLASDLKYNNVTELYQGLEYGHYQVKITVLAGSDNCHIEGFQYATYLVQTPMTQKALSSESPSDIDDVPPLTTLLGGTYSEIAATTSSAWNGIGFFSESVGASAEYKFYGSSIYLCIYFSSTYDCAFSVTIDGGTTYVKNSSISLPSYDGNRPVWVRLDNGALPQGVHTVKIETTTASASQKLLISGWAHYSSKFPTTCSRSLICGKGSYAVGSDSSDFTYNGAWTAGDLAQSFLGREKFTSTNNDYVTITTPTNLKAIYLISAVDTNRGEIVVSLGGASSNLRYINLDTSNYGQHSFIQVLYDSYMDGISLDGQELRISKNGGTTYRFEGIIFEIGDAVENDSIFCMPKWTRYNASSNNLNPVSTSHRLDVYGSKSDASTGRHPMVHSSWIYHPSGNYTHYRHGLNTQDMTYKYEGNAAEPAIYQLMRSTNNDLYNFYGDYGLISTSSFAHNYWLRIALFPDRVI
tara:strand:+ start:20695 stop:23085 length:2391 start_codon:yes stop_codon:yes gene_type:complete